KDCHQIVLLARQKSTMMLRVKRHSVTALAVPDGISPYDSVSCRIDDREDVLVLQVDVYLAGYGIVLRHSGFTVEMYCAYNLIFLYVNDGFGFAPLIRDVKLMKGRGIGAAVWLRFSL